MIGIYKLVFMGTSKVYIGQSTRIEIRFMEHLNKMRSGTHFPKLQYAYNTYGTPSLEIIIECEEDKLNLLEKEYIDKYNSFAEGFNGTNEPGSPNLSGINSPHCKCDRDTYISIFKDLVNTRLYIKDIANKYNTTEDIVKSISLGKTHSWLAKEYPEEYKTLLSIRGNRQKKYKGTAILKSPEGELFEVDCSIREFARIHDLRTPSQISNLINGKRKTYLKWTLHEIIT